MALFKNVYFYGTIIILLSFKKLSAATISDEQLHLLLNEIADLKKEVHQLKKELHHHTKASSIPTNRHSQKKSPLPAARSTKSKKTPSSKPQVKKSPPASKQEQFLLINPDLGTSPAYDGSDLLSNLAQQNADLLLLQYRQELDKKRPNNVYTVLSGSLGNQVYSSQTYTNATVSDIDLVTANLSLLAGIGPWVTGFLSLDYDNFAPNELSPPQFGPRYLNSRVYVDQGFITIGNLDHSAWYASLGQMYIPFGAFNGFMINSPLTSSLFTTLERPLLLGFSHSTDVTELDLTAYAYKGETFTSLTNSVINQWGTSLDYSISKSQWNGSAGVAYISNIADAEGIQLNGQNQTGCFLFNGLAFPCRQGELLQHSVPGFDIHAYLTRGPYSLTTEWITAVKPFAVEDVSFNYHGARPQAFDIEGAYAFNAFNKPVSFALGYSFTKESLAFLLPAKEYSVALTTSLWRSTTESIGFQHDINYSKRDEGGGQYLPVGGRINLGRTSNTVIFAFNASF